MDVPVKLSKFLLFAVYLFCCHLPCIPVLYKNHLISLELGAFYINLLKIHPIQEIWTPSAPRLWWKPLNRYTKIREKANQKAGT